MTPWQTLMADSRTWKAVDQLLSERYDLCDEHIFPLLQHISALPGLWEEHDSETPRERRERRGTLTKKMKGLADDIERDPEARGYSIFDHGSLTSSPMLGKYTIAQVLRFMADQIERPGNLRDANNSYIPDTRSTRSTLKDYVKRDIALQLFDMLGKKPAAAAALLSNAVLELDSHQHDAVTTEQMKAVFTNMTKQKKGRIT